tara:strand:- start:15087 stop:15779 length:693 start_codon:yes stop_codon:yes gene_type:complete
MLDLVQLNAPAFLDLLPEQVAEKVRRESTVVKYTDGQFIQSRGDPNPGISIVRSGVANAAIIGIDGSVSMTTLLGPGQSFGEFTIFAELPRTHDVSATGPTEIYQIPATRFKRLYDNEPELSRALLKTALIRSHILLEMLDAIRRLPIRERTAKILQSMSHTAGNPNLLECRQSELAFTLGVSRISLNRALKQLAELNLIELGYREINIPAPEILADWVTTHCNPAPLSS